MLPEKQQLHKYVITEGHSKTLGAKNEKDGVRGFQTPSSGFEGIPPGRNVLR